MKRVSWLVVSGLMALSLVLAACAPAAVQETERKITVTEKEEAAKKTPEKEAVTEKVAVSSDVPKYGGTLNLGLGSDITAFDDIVTRAVTPGTTFALTNEPIWVSDWAKGKAGGHGTSELDFFRTHDVFDVKVGLAAESWQWQIDAQTDTGTVVYKVRQGVHYALNTAREASRLVGGREMTADDVVFSFKQLYEDPRSSASTSDLAKVIKIQKTGPWEITISNLPALQTRTLMRGWGDSRPYIVPPEVVQRYGDMGKWQNSVGAGPFMLVDHLPGSITTLGRNPNYWMKDPVGPGKGNQLPYIERLRFLILPDASTREAALRTGKIDRMSGVQEEQLGLFRKYSPDLISVFTDTTGPPGIGKFPIQMRQDKPPFNDVRVRQAVLLATDLNAINQSLFGGLGYIHTWPYEYDAAFAAAYLPLDDPAMPASVRELYTYNPEKAKQLMKEAGYPNGFKTTATILAGEVDYWAILKDMWSKIGIDLVFDTKADGATKRVFLVAGNLVGFTSYGWHIPYNYYGLYIIETDGGFNYGKASDPLVDAEMLKARQALVYEGNEAKAMKIVRDLWPYILTQVFAIPVPYGPVYTIWWPWLKNYSGENTMGFHIGGRWVGFVWIDQDLKTKMGY